jgi:hypothetical protein
MSNTFTFNIQVAEPPPGSCVARIPGLVQYLQSAITLQVQGEITGTKIIRSQVAPGPDDQDAIWLREDNIGTTLGLFTFVNGDWRRIPAVGIGTRAFYNGSVAGVFDPLTLFGVHGGEFDGWQIDYTFADKFIASGAQFNTSTGYWVSNIAGSLQQQGGAATVTLGLANVPRLSFPGLKTVLWEAQGNAPGGDSDLWGVAEPNFPANVTLLPADPGNTEPIPVSILPPWVAMAQIVYRGTGIGT